MACGQRLVTAPPLLQQGEAVDEGMAGELALSQRVAFGIVCHEVDAVFANVEMG